MKRSFFVFLVTFFVSISAPATYNPFRGEIPADDRVLLQTGTPSLRTAPSTVRVLVWNIHKAFAGQAWLNDFKSMADQSDLVFVQEGFMVPIYKQALTEIEGFVWSFVTSFFYKGNETGVMTGSRWPLSSSTWHRSRNHEPLVGTPKMSLAVILPLADGQKLLAINIHALNFTLTSSFRNQIAPLADLIGKHEGPVIFAGDFNTWNPMRTNFLLNSLAAAGMEHVTFPNDRRYLVLDHVFTRGLKVNSAQILTQISTSDHSPLDISFEPKAVVSVPPAP